MDAKKKFVQSLLLLIFAAIYSLTEIIDTITSEAKLVPALETTLFILVFLAALYLLLKHEINGYDYAKYLMLANMLLCLGFTLAGLITWITTKAFQANVIILVSGALFLLAMFQDPDQFLWRVFNYIALPLLVLVMGVVAGILLFGAIATGTGDPLFLAELIGNFVGFLCLTGYAVVSLIYVHKQPFDLDPAA